MAESRIPTDSDSRQRDSEATPCDTNAALPVTATRKPTGHGVSLGWPASARSGSETVSFISSSQADCACALVPCRRTPASLFCRACGACRAGVDAAGHGPWPVRVGRIRSSSLRDANRQCAAVASGVANRPDRACSDTDWQSALRLRHSQRPALRYSGVSDKAPACSCNESRRSVTVTYSVLTAQ